jgi:bacteriocin biosynthesis cyclodehydratase domain-containing protein
MSLLQFPSLKPWLRVLREEDALVLEHARTSWSFDGPTAAPVLAELLPLLDGTRTVPDIVELVGDEFADSIESLVSLLQEHDLLLEGPPVAAGTPAAVRESVLQLAASDPRPASQLSPILRRFREAHISVVGGNALGTTAVETLRASGLGNITRCDDIPEAPAAGQCTLVLVTPESDELDALDRWNEAMLATSTAWLPVLPYDGLFAAVGPLIVPWETACYRCYLSRKAAALGVPTIVASQRKRSGIVPTGPVLGTFLAALASMVVTRWVGIQDPFLAGRMLAVDFGYEGPRLESHDVLRVPRCAACSTSRGPMPLPWYDRDLAGSAEEADPGAP